MLTLELTNRILGIVVRNSIDFFGVIIGFLGVGVGDIGTIGFSNTDIPDWVNQSTPSEIKISTFVNDMNGGYGMLGFCINIFDMRLTLGIWFHRN